MTFKAAVKALSDYVVAGYTALPVLVDPTKQPAIATLPDGWVALHFEFGDQGPTSGRFGPASTYYNSVGVLTCTVMVPRKRGDGPAWAAADALADLCRQARVGDVTFLRVRVSPAPLDDADTHHQVDVVATFELEAFVSA